MTRSCGELVCPGRQNIHMGSRLTLRGPRSPFVPDRNAPAASLRNDPSVQADGEQLASSILLDALPAAAVGVGAAETRTLAADAGAARRAEGAGLIVASRAHVSSAGGEAIIPLVAQIAAPTRTSSIRHGVAVARITASRGRRGVWKLRAHHAGNPTAAAAERSVVVAVVHEGVAIGAAVVATGLSLAGQVGPRGRRALARRDLALDLG